MEVKLRHMASGALVDFVSGNGLLPDGTKPPPGPMQIYCHLYALEQTPIKGKRHDYVYRKGEYSSIMIFCVKYNGFRSTKCIRK